MTGVARSANHPVKATVRAGASHKRSRWGKTLLAVAVSASIIGVLYSKFDVHEVLRNLGHVNVSLVLLGVAIHGVAVVLTGWRCVVVMPRTEYLTIGEAVRLQLVASVVNLIVPAKLGDLSRSYFISLYGGIPFRQTVTGVIFERVCDVFGLLSWSLLGIGCAMIVSTHEPGGRQPTGQFMGYGALLVPVGCVWAFGSLLVFCPHLISRALSVVQRCVFALPRKVDRVVQSAKEAWRSLRQHHGHRITSKLALLSLLLWATHMAQITCFVHAVDAAFPAATALALSSIVLLSGLVPLTFAGLGVRDAAFVVVFAGHLTPEEALTVAVLATSRAVVPRVAALFVLHRYVDEIQRASGRSIKAHAG